MRIRTDSRRRISLAAAAACLTGILCILIAAASCQDLSRILSWPEIRVGDTFRILSFNTTD